MTNSDRYKTAKERAEAFAAWVQEHPFKTLANPAQVAFDWLDLEAEAEEPLPCPFCGCKVQVVHDTQAIAVKAKWLINCYGCNYEFGAETKEALIAAHNRVARAAKVERQDMGEHILLCGKEANDANA